ncbi:response regulator [Paenibacillus sp. 1P07SE]|uniref:response regulator n=1 Tax=Paenibacillus sp. 1P07SE TaxID=3132209 RepID=UPI0039A5C8E8
MKVMIVDDEDIIRQGVKVLLEKSHPSIQVIAMAKNGKEALKLIEQDPPDLLIADIRMPVMNGLELIERAAAHGPEMVSVVLTGYADFEYAQKALKSGVADYIVKPVNQVKINQMVQAVLSKNPTRWLDGIEVAQLKDIKELAMAIVKHVLAENAEEVRNLIAYWREYCRTNFQRFHDMRQAMGIVRLTIQTELLAGYSSVVRINSSPLEGSTPGELIEEWQQELTRLIDEIAGKRVPRNKRIVDFVLQEIDRDFGNQELNIRLLADRAGVSAAYLSKMFREIVNQPYTHYLNELRLHKARQLLLSGRELRIGQLAEVCGFSDYPHFSKLFKKRFGLAPQEYREKFQSDPGGDIS